MSVLRRESPDMRLMAATTQILDSLSSALTELRKATISTPDGDQVAAVLPALELECFALSGKWDAIADLYQVTLDCDKY